MLKNYQNADESLKKSENKKSEKNSNYIDKNYSIEEREKIVDLVKFYAEWLYGPVEEDIDNKLYFLPENKTEYFYESLKNKFDELDVKEKEKNKNLFGIKFIG